MTQMKLSPRAEELYRQLRSESEKNGYFLNPDLDITFQLVEGLVTNEKRYGYQMCPCRLAFGEKEKDQDVICPCDYRDEDVDEFGACFCGLYVDREAAEGKKKVKSIPERRPIKFTMNGFETVEKKQVAESPKTAIKVWRCRACGYLCARNAPPNSCPICGLKDRFEQFVL